MSLYANPSWVFLIGVFFGVAGGFVLAGFLKGGRDE